MRAVLLFVLLIFAQLTSANSAPIHEAAKRGSVADLTAALDAGADINKPALGATPLYSAVLRGHAEAVKFLIARGADVNAKARMGTPLMAAAARGAPDLVNLLISSGADVNVDLETKTALHVAAERGCLECVQALVEAGADVNARHVTGSNDLIYINTPLHLAVTFEHQDVANYLVDHGVIVPKPDPISQKLASADVTRGSEIFEKLCLKCHAIKPDASVNSGPPLWAIVGRDKGGIPDFAYSKTLLTAGGAWGYEDLNVFLSSPTVTTPGVKMEMQGVPDETDRINVIAYLRTLSDDPVPLP